MSKVRFPLSDIKFHNIPVVGQFYTKQEVDKLIKDAVDEARKIDEESMAKHNRDATVISMILGFTTLALFVDGLLRLLGITPPFLDIDINIIDKIAEKVESDIVPLIQRVPRI
jgi:hypothetical protein|tara:strand:- start:354 stop:692 length:339 start_codon:yes stop_codon:yes gene_type:complete